MPVCATFFTVLRANQKAANLGSAIHCYWARYVWHRVAQKHNCATFSATTCAKRRLSPTNLGGDQGRLLREGEPEVLYLFRFNPRGSGRSQEQDVQEVHEVQNDWGECAKMSDVAGSRPHGRHINCTVSTPDWAAICAIYMLPMAAEDVVNMHLRVPGTGGIAVGNDGGKTASNGDGRLPVFFHRQRGDPIASAIAPKRPCHIRNSSTQVPCKKEFVP